MSLRLFFLVILISAAPVSASAGAHPINMAKIKMIESSGRPRAIGSAGERGLYQITPAVLADYLKARPADKGDLFDPVYSRRVAEWQFERLFKRCKTVPDTIIAWNRGLGNWRKWKRAGAKASELPAVTRDYLKKYFRK